MAEPVITSAPAAAPAPAFTETEQYQSAPAPVAPETEQYKPAPTAQETEQYKPAPTVTESNVSVSEKSAQPDPVTQHGLDTRIPEQNVLAQQLGSGKNSELQPDTEKRTEEEINQNKDAKQASLATRAVGMLGNMVGAGPA